MKFLHRLFLEKISFWFYINVRQQSKKQKLFESEVPTVKVNKIRMRETVISYAFLAPVLIFFTVFVLAPMIMGFITSFFNYSMTSFEFVGLDNYIRMFKDPVFTKSLINTVI